MAQARKPKSERAEAAQVAEPTAAAEEESQTVDAVQEEDLVPRSLPLTVPVAPVPEGIYIPRHVDVQLDLRQGQAQRMLCEGLDKVGARLRNGRRVTVGADAVRWVLEQVADAVVGPERAG